MMIDNDLPENRPNGDDLLLIIQRMDPQEVRLVFEKAMKALQARAQG